MASNAEQMSARLADGWYLASKLARLLELQDLVLPCGTCELAALVAAKQLRHVSVDGVAVTTAEAERAANWSLQELKVVARSRPSTGKDA
jgi:hypothetical protein